MSIDPEVDLVAKDHGVEAHGRQAIPLRQSSHPSLQLAVEQLAVGEPVAERLAEGFDAVPPLPRMHADGVLQVHQRYEAAHRQVANGRVHSRGVDRAEVAHPPHDLAGRNAVTDHRAEVEQVARPVHDYTIERGATRPLCQDQVDRIVVRSRNAPQECRRAMRRHRPGPCREDGRGYPLLSGSRRAVDAGDAGMQQFQPAVVDRPVPGHPRVPGPPQAGAGYETVVSCGEWFEDLQLHTQPGRRPAAETEGRIGSRFRGPRVTDS